MDKNIIRRSMIVIGLVVLIIAIFAIMGCSGGGIECGGKLCEEGVTSCCGSDCWTSGYSCCTAINPTQSTLYDSTFACCKGDESGELGCPISTLDGMQLKCCPSYGRCVPQHIIC